MPDMIMNPNDFADMDAAWANTPETSSVDDGCYIAEIVAFRPEYSKNMKRMIKMEMDILGIGKFAGRKLWRNYVLESDDADKTKTMLGMCKSDLRRMGIDVDAATFQFGVFITQHGGAMIGRKVKVSAKTTTKDGQTNQNINILGKGDTKGSGLASDAEIQAYAAGAVLNPNGTVGAAGAAGVPGNAGVPQSQVLHGELITTPAPAAANPWD